MKSVGNQQDLDNGDRQENGKSRSTTGLWHLISWRRRATGISGKGERSMPGDDCSTTPTPAKTA